MGKNLSRGPQSAKLSLEQITRLRHVQTSRRGEAGSIPQLAKYMKAPFRWQTLSQALRGRPIRLINFQFIVDWLNEQKTETRRPANPRPPQVPAVRG
jgi:phosphatidylserine/phosphatidylglycerophosphate/cardiolipin synthase-like enzyme